MIEHLIAKESEIFSEYATVRESPAFHKYVRDARFDQSQFESGPLILEFRGWAVCELAAYQGSFRTAIQRDPRVSTIYYAARTLYLASKGNSAEMAQELSQKLLEMESAGADPVWLNDAAELAKSGWRPL